MRYKPSQELYKEKDVYTTKAMFKVKLLSLSQELDLWKWKHRNIFSSSMINMSPFISSEPGHSISYSSACAPGEDSDQPIHAAKTQISLFMCAGWSESSLSA